MRKYGCVECGNEIPETEKYCDYCKRARIEKKKVSCAECGELFIKYTIYQKHCSEKCRKNTKCSTCKNIIRRGAVCKECNPVIINKKESNEQCQYPKIGECIICNKEFHKKHPQHKYCSDECRIWAADAVYSNNKFLILNRDGFRCMYCGCTPADKKELVLDHVFPYVRGGKSVAGNLVTSCVSCNSSKTDNLLSISGQKYITEYVMKANKENNINPDKPIRGSHTRGED